MVRNENDEDLLEDEYIISRIAGLKKNNRKRYFLIEWDGYHITENTWEEEANVFSEIAIRNFYNEYEKLYGVDIKSLKDINKPCLLNDTYDPDSKKFTPITIKSATSATVQITQATASIKRGRLDDYFESRITKLKKTEQLNEPVSAIDKLAAAPQEFLDTVNEVKRRITQTMKVHPIELYTKRSSRTRVPIYHFQGLDVEVTIVNEVDVDSDKPVLPDDFMYITDLSYTPPVIGPDPEFLTACSCRGSFDCTDGCHEDTYAYDDDGRLVLSSGSAIYECNAACSCSDNCNNRVVQRGRKIPLEIFKTNTKGWGVRSKKAIPRGTFIEQYVGEVLTMDEGDIRGKVYDGLECSYLFDMDFAQSELPIKYVIDSFVIGNVSRFFNHSCSPNLEVFVVYYDSADAQMHRLAFFAKEDIEENEELCFDYNGRVDLNAVNEDHDRYACQCNAPNCRRWIYS